MENQNQDQPSHTTVASSLNPIPLHKRHFKPFWPLFIVLLVSIGVGGYVVWISLHQDSREESGLVSLRKFAKKTEQVFKKSSQQPKELATAHNVFGFEILKQIKGSENGNIFISPTSISLALSMVYNGANGQTKEEMASVLHLKSLDLETVNKQSLRLIEDLFKADPKVKLAIANSVWARQGMDFKKDFLQTLGYYFNAKATALDFSSPTAVDTINNWASDNTNGKIPTIIGSIPDSAVMYLINAVYFKGEWHKQFDKTLTQERDFHLADGSTKKQPLMTQTSKDFKYFEDGDLQSIRLPYGKNDRLAMYIFLPVNVDSFVGSLDNEKWEKFMSQYEYMEGTVLIPKFKLEYEKSLNSDLTALGMPQAFSESADFGGISDLRDIQISDVKHKTFVEVNEEGTEAAAVTGIEMSITSIAPAKKTFYMEVNKPFFFVIRDDQTLENLFMGVIKDF